jgi:hypothetical protein
MKSFRPIFRSLLCLSILQTACSSDPAPVKVSAAQACEEYSKASCAKTAQCQSFALTAIFGDAQTCEARVRVNCIADLAATGTSSTPESVATCAKDAKATLCADLTIGKRVPSCAALPGTLNEGDACNFNTQCTSTFCKPVSGTGCGKCKKREAVGALCSTSADCEVGASCSQQKCVLPANFGEECAPEKPCAGSLKCIDRKCVQPLAIGADCVSEPCVGGAYCDGATKKCTEIAVASANEVCGAVQGKVSLCKASGFCNPAPGATCLPSAADGGGCDDISGPRCMFPATCVAGKCTLPQDTVCKK